MKRQTEFIEASRPGSTALQGLSCTRASALRRVNHALASVLATSLMAGSVFAQQAFDENLDGWNYDKVYQGWSAESLLDEGVAYGVGGEELGDIENILLNEQGQIVALVAQVGGLWDIGDTHLAVPWDQVRFENERVTIPVTEETIDAFEIFRTEYFTTADTGTVSEVDDDLGTGPSIWKATQLMDDYAVLESGDGYGYVDDLVFDQQGKLVSVLVDASTNENRGYYGYPWYGGGNDDYVWDPGRDYYVLPYSADVVSEFDVNVDVDQIDPMPQ